MSGPDQAPESEFDALARIGGRAQRIHEIGQFVREGGRWYYVSGVVG